MSEPYQISITKTGDATVCSIDMWRDVQEKIERFFADRTKEEAVRQLREIGFERVVRCGDCKHFRSHGGDYLFCNLAARELDGGDGFCAWGERRDA